MLIGKDDPPLTQYNNLEKKKLLDKYRNSSYFAIFFHSMPSAELPCVPLRKHLESLSEATALRWR